VAEITASMNSCQPLPSGATANCNLKEKPVIVAMMPEQGSYNAATLTQKANYFGGALAAQVFSAGFAAQKRSQTFYPYRDIDTLAFQEPEMPSERAANPQSLYFGWQFGPVFGAAQS